MSTEKSSISTGAMLPNDCQHWIAKLSPNPEASHLLLDAERTNAYACDQESIEIAFSTETTERLARLANDSPFLLYGALTAGLKVCLYKHSANQVIVVGSPPRKKQQSTPWQAPALPIIDEVNDQLSFRQLLLNVRATLLEAYSRQNYDFTDLIQQLGLSHVTNRCPLFDVMIALEDIHGEPFEMRNDLTLRFAGQGPTLRGQATFNSRLLTRASVERFLGHFECLLQKALAQPDTPIGRLSLLTGAEREQVVRIWNNTAIKYPDTSCLHDLFEAQVRRTPEALALVFANQQISYAELNRRANQVAHYLRRLGVGPEVAVGLCLERSIEMLVGLMGILKAGGAYLPLDPTYPADRLAFMLQDARVPVLLTQNRLLPALSAAAARVVCLDTEGPVIAQETGDDLTAVVAPENAAYVIYTSGSTGQPKGVIVAHRGLCNMAMAQIRDFRIRADMRVLQFASLSFDASISEIALTWVAGATLYLADAETLLAGSDLTAWLRAQRISCVTLPPSVLAVSSPEELPELEALIAAGESCPKELVTRWAPGRNFYNAYGPTETTVCATIGECFAETPKASIGRPIGNTQIYLVDEQLQPVRVGIAGELLIGGVGLARGYLRRPGITAERFIPNPFSPEPGARLYRTGDLARYLPDGRIEFLRRVDHQVKVRGYRIEVGEIENALGGHPGVLQCVVMAREDMPGNQQLVAYLVADQEHPVNAAELRQILQTKLPRYMIPTAYFFLEKLPLTPNGKVDRKALSQMEMAQGRTIEVSRSFPNPVAEVLASIWADVLGIDAVGLQDNFLELGGHSLLATRVFSRVREAFQVDLPIRALFDAPTLAELTMAVEQAMATTDAAAPPIRRIARGGDFPLSFGQERLWLIHRLEPNSSLYNIPLALRLKGSLNSAALEWCLAEVVRRHESLRTTFRTVGGSPRQFISEGSNVQLLKRHLRGPLHERETEARHLAIEEARQPFDLEHGPLWRATLLQLDDEEHLLLFTIHHIITDGWSLGVLTREVADLYEAHCQGLTSPLAELPVQYADYAWWQREHLRGDVLENQLAYWKQQLTDVPTTLELASRHHTAAPGDHGETEHIKLTASLTDSLRTLSRREGVTLFMTLLAAFKVLLYRYSGQEEVVVGTPVANRNRPEVEGLIGFFINTLPLYTNLAGNPTLQELLSRVRQVALGAYAHQEVPLEKLISALQLKRETAQTDLFHAVFVLQNAPTSQFKLTDVTLSALDIFKETTQSDLYFSITETEAGLTASLKYRSDLFDGKMIAGMLSNFEVVLTTMTTHPECRLLDVPVENGHGGKHKSVGMGGQPSFQNDRFLF